MTHTAERLALAAAAAAAAAAGSLAWRWRPYQFHVDTVHVNTYGRPAVASQVDATRAGYRCGICNTLVVRGHHLAGMHVSVQPLADGRQVGVWARMATGEIMHQCAGDPLEVRGRVVAELDALQDRQRQTDTPPGG